ncbi:carbamoyl phosphate synthase-like protein [Corynebacterium renale]|uniref:Carbamoylphosphate synthase large subunit n=1 Tax=Corynebacterium renale TaxID=1724 RepID=A0A2A9DL68_9CORY|nr:ATP-grasp domain-containing protein [Corynebacterium renale]PFG27343.1 carbamoylphosphate synthase large subunit [Corynebacterium renale]SQG63921.1 carbamoyl phosphate synthase-like protein [Corynebacterium renale]SQI23570.1 carbamoyl phosphate synthase-like protein [Corynebacterium renale]STD02939.1 carbamoyl phosphate synthase-like protein [Corynebacterium renale]
MITILVSGAGGPAGSSLIRQLRFADTSTPLRIIATDISAAPTVATLADDFLLGPRADSPALLPFLQRTIAEYGVDVFIPTVQDELPAVAAAADILGARVLLSSVPAVAVCNDKWLTALALEDRGVAVPHTTAGTAESHEFPVVVKPRVSRGGRGVVVADTPGDLPDLDDALIVQSFAPGTEYCPQLFIHPADEKADVVVLRKTVLRDGRVGNADAVERVTEPDPEADAVAALARRAARALNLAGPVDMDIRIDAAGNPVVLEINARFGANSAHAPELLDGVLRMIGAR